MATKHRVLVIGVGSIGERHLRCFRNTGRAELALCEVNEALRADVARRYGVGRAFGRFEDALAEPHDVAVIATPAPLHVPQATRLAEAGVHLLIEKPLSTSLDGVDRLRICCHQSTDDRLHEMLMVFTRATYIRPSLHTDKDESLLFKGGNFSHTDVASALPRP